MGTFAEEIVDDLVTQSLAAAKGTDIFYNEMPDTDISPVTVIAVQEDGGIVSDGTPAPWIAVQFTVRSVTSWETARIRAAQIYNRYHDAVAITLSHYRIMASKALALPHYVGADSRGRYLERVTISFCVVAITQVVGGTGYGGSKDPNISAL